MEVQITNDLGTNHWDDIWDSYSTNDPPKNITSRVSNSFTTIYPYASLRYPIFPWFGLEGSVGYFQIFYDSNAWKTDESEVAGSQEIGLSRPIYRISMIFGG